MFSSFLKFCCFFTPLKVREISGQNMRNSEKWVFIVLGSNAYHPVRNKISLLMYRNQGMLGEKV